MKKNIIITAGPTNERLDSVMKITNMSTGALGAIVADEMLTNHTDEIDHLYYLSTKLSYKPKQTEQLKLVTIESTLDLLNALKELLTTLPVHAVIHSAAVGDYKGEYAITGEQLASLIAQQVKNFHGTTEELEAMILGIIEHPPEITSSETKISSYEKNLMFKLTLTPKVIHEIKKIAPTTKLVGFKLLDKVAPEELLAVAKRLQEKNQADYIVANDLSKIGNGLHPATILGEDGIVQTCQTKQEIAKVLCKVLLETKKPLN